MRKKLYQKRRTVIQSRHKMDTLMADISRVVTTTIEISIANMTRKRRSKTMATSCHSVDICWLLSGEAGTRRR